MRVAAALLVVVGILVPAHVNGQARFEVVRSLAASPAPREPESVPRIRATDGNVYGTTLAGGPADAGTVFRVVADGRVTLVYAFTGGGDGASPSGLVQGTDGGLYGTTAHGGTADAGTVFRITLAGTFTVLHRFTHTDGATPNGPLVVGSDGNFYGTTHDGGDFLAGTIFKITPAGVLTVLYSFTGGADGGSPLAGLVQATDLSLHGTTEIGGALGMGTAFRLDAVVPPQGLFTIRGGGDLDWQPSGGGFGPTSTSSPTSASGTISDPHGSAAYSIAAGPGVVRGSLEGSFTSVGRFNPSIQADASSELTLVGPTGYVAIPVSLNLHVDSTFTVEECPDSCNISIGVMGYGGTTRFSITPGFTENGLGLTADPIPGGYHLHGDVATPAFGLTPNLPAPIGISLAINDNNLNHGYEGASVFTVGPSIVSFSPSGPVLNGVPAGYTVSGPGVVDNYWTDPLVPDIELQFADGTPMSANPVVDLGDVASGHVVEGGYQIANTGIARLDIANVEVLPFGAGVAEAPVPSSPNVDPASVASALVRCGGTNAGPGTREVMFDVGISSNDPDESPSVFRVRCSVLPEPPGRPIIELQFADGTPMPAGAELDLGDVASGNVAEGSYLIANIGNGRLQIADVQVARYSAFGVTEAPLPTNPSIDPTGATAALVRCGGTNPDSTSRSLFFDVSISGSGLVSAVQAGFRVRCTVLPAPVSIPDIELRLLNGTPLPASNSIVDLGTVPSGSVKPGAVIIANVGGATLEVSDITHDTPASGVALAPSLSASISPGGNSLAQIGCGGPNADTTPLTVEFAVVVHSDDPDEASAQFTVRCHVLPASINPLPPTPDIELRFIGGTPMPDPAILDIGNVTSGEAKNQAFEIGNLGDATLVISSFLAEPASGDIHPAGIDFTTILLHGKTLAYVSCQGVNTGSTPSVRTATLKIVSNDPDEGTVSLTVRCTILPRPPDIDLRFANGVSMPVGATLDLGETPSGVDVTGGFIVANVGGETLRISSISNSQAFPTGHGYVELSGADHGIPNGQEVQGSVRCGGTNTEAIVHRTSFTVSIESNDPDESPVQFTVVCKVLPAPPPDIELRFNDHTPMPAVHPTLDLGDVPSGESITGHFRVANVGDGTPYISGALLVSQVTHTLPPFGQDTANATIGALGAVIEAGSEASGVVTCGGTNLDADAHVSTFTARIIDNDPDEPFVDFTVVCRILPKPRPDIELRFSDHTPMPAVNPTLDLGDVASGESVQGIFRVGNVGNGTPNVSGVLIVSQVTHTLPPFGRDTANATIGALGAVIEAGNEASGFVTCGGTNFDTDAHVSTFTARIIDNDPDEPFVDFTVVCRILPAPPDIELRFSGGTPMPANATIDLGEVAADATVTGTFRVANVGDASLSIASVRVSPARYESGSNDEADMSSLHYTVGAGQEAGGFVRCGRPNPSSVPVSHSFAVLITSNDPDEGTVSFSVHCTVLPKPRPDIELRFSGGTPMPANATLDLGEVAADATVTGTFRVANVGDASLSIASVRVSPARYESGSNDEADMSSLHYTVGAGQEAGGFVRCGRPNPSSVPVSHSFAVLITSNDPDEGTVSFSVHCTVLPEAIPPTITAVAAPGRNANGWNNTNVTVSYTCSDLGSGYNSGVDQAASSLGDDVLTASGTAVGTCVDRAGNSASASYTAQIDKTVPTVGFQGNAGTYSVLGMVAITCAAFDPLSGVASTNCVTASGPAWSFGAGPHTLSATATDRAGNTASGSTTFTVSVTPSGLTALTRQFVQSSARYQALRLGQRAAVDAIVTAACNFLLNVSPTMSPAQRAAFINAYRQAVQALVAPGWLTATQAATLKTLAGAI